MKRKSATPPAPDFQFDHEKFLEKREGKNGGKTKRRWESEDAYLAEMGRVEQEPREIVIERNGRPRQAGASPAIAGMQPELVEKIRVTAEKSLYFFAKVVLNRSYLTSTLHLPMANWLTDYSAVRRKLLLFPREHAKTSVVSHAMPLHMQIQEAESNLYFPGWDGSETTLILCCETQKRAEDHIRVQEQAWEMNRLLRALWPKRSWEKPSRDARVWNAKEYIIPREKEYPDPTVRGLGVDGAITGAHPLGLIKDDLISVEAANSPTVMQSAIHWHVTSRALINKKICLEITIGTRWAVHDLYAHMMQEDKKVLQYWVRSMVEHGKLIYPEMFATEDIPRLQKEFGAMFPLLYMNSAADPSLVDFDVEKLRRFRIEKGQIVYHGESRDLLLEDRVNRGMEDTVDADALRGMKLDAQLLEQLSSKEQYLRLRVA